MEYLFSFEVHHRIFVAHKEGNSVIVSINMGKFRWNHFITINYKEDAFNGMAALKEDVIRIVTNHLRLPTGGS